MQTILSKLHCKYVTAALSLFLALSLASPLAAADRSIGTRDKQPTQGKRLALIIGNSAYASSPLKNPANDATDIKNALEKLNFDVIFRIDASQEEMEQGINDFGKRLHAYDVGLFYYAGHGVQIKGENYLIPVSPAINEESELRYRAVNAGLVLGKMWDAAVPMNIIILDACRNNPFASTKRSASRGLAEMKDAPPDSLIIYSTALGKVAQDGSGRNGVFTKYLLEDISTPNLEIAHLIMSVRGKVIKETGGDQVPWTASSATNSFYFNFDPSKNDKFVYQPTIQKRPAPASEPEEPADPHTPKLGFMLSSPKGATLAISGNRYTIDSQEGVMLELPEGEHPFSLQTGRKTLYGKLTVARLGEDVVGTTFGLSRKQQLFNPKHIDAALMGVPVTYRLGVSGKVLATYKLSLRKIY